MLRRPPRSTLDRSSAASDVYKRQASAYAAGMCNSLTLNGYSDWFLPSIGELLTVYEPVSYTHLRAHETVLDLVCRLLLEKKKKT